MSRVYPEIVGFRSRGRDVPPPEFPDQCPVCGAGVFKRAGLEDWIVYKCGGMYEPKPQIQTHTDYFWGRCPKGA